MLMSLGVNVKDQHNVINRFVDGIKQVNLFVGVVFMNFIVSLFLPVYSIDHWCFQTNKLFSLENK